MRIAFVEQEERGALRLFLRALRRLDPGLAWEAVVHSERGPSSSTPLRADLLERVHFVDDALQALSGADVLVAASDGVAPAPGLLVRAQAAGAVPLASRLAVYEETLGDGEAGLLFEPNDLETLAAQLGRLVADRSCASACARRRARARGARWPTSSRPCTARWPPAATTRAAIRRSPAGCAGGASSTSTCTCTPTTATTAPRRSRCCSPPRATRAWARSR